MEQNWLISPQTRAHYTPSPDWLNVSMDFNAAPSGTARGTEVIIPDNASPEVRAAAERYNQMVADFAARHGIADYPVRGVRTRSENGRGVAHTVHTEPFFNTDLDFQRAVQANLPEFAAIYREAFGGLEGARVIAPHGVDGDMGATSDIFGNETEFGRMVANAALGNDYELPEMAPSQDSADSDLLALVDRRSRPAEPSGEEGNPLSDRLTAMNALSQFRQQAGQQDVRNYLTQPQQQASLGFAPGTNPFLVG